MLNNALHGTMLQNVPQRNFQMVKIGAGLCGQRVVHGHNLTQSRMVFTQQRLRLVRWKAHPTAIA